jgi:hypothetical protein
MSHISEDLIKITEYKVLGKLPDPFLRADGTRASTPEEFEEHKAELYKNAVELQYGTIPPKPEVLRVEHLYKGKATDQYKIICGTKEKQISFVLRIYFPKNTENPPVVVDGDMCFGYYENAEYINTMTENGIAFAIFNRVELAHDLKGEGRRQGALYEVYPEYTFGALGAWAWGFMRVVDALEMIGGFNMDCVAFTGHSRGGKTAMLAGVLDKRAAIVAPNETNAGSCSCYRIHMKAITENGDEKRSETLKDLWHNFGYWLGEGMEAYTECEEELPFDCHFLKALVAPRTLFIAEAASDIWTNPVGSWMTTQAVGEVYKLYGKPENLLWYYRKGFHFHAVEDVEMLVNVIKNKLCGEPLNDKYFKTPFPTRELIYDWRCPESEVTK